MYPVLVAIVHASLCSCSLVICSCLLILALLFYCPYRLVSPVEAGDKTEIDLGIPRGAGSSSKEFTVRGCPNGEL